MNSTQKDFYQPVKKVMWKNAKSFFPKELILIIQIEKVNYFEVIFID